MRSATRAKLMLLRLASHPGGHTPIMPKASKDKFGGVESGVVVVAWSRDTEVTAASPYLILTGAGTLVCPLLANGWIKRPSTAAQIKSFRARPGIIFKTNEVLYS